MKPSLLMLVAGLSAATLQGQNTMEVVRIGGSDNQFSLATIEKITFTPTDMVVANPNTSIPMDDIAVITFTDIPLSAVPKTSSKPFAKKELFLASSASRVLVSFAISKPGAVRVTITDGRGRTVRTLTKQSAVAGTVSLSWDKKDEKGARVASGIYLVSALADGKKLTSPQLILK